MLDINDRLTRLEKQNRRLMVAAYGFPALVLMVMLLGADKASAPRESKFGTIIAEKIVVGGANGKSGITLSADDVGARIQLKNSNGKVRAMLAMQDGVSGFLEVVGEQNEQATISASKGIEIALRPAGQRHPGVLISANGDGGGTATIEATNSKDEKKSIGFGFVGADTIKQFDP